jgi:uncharacterized protein YggE
MNAIYRPFAFVFPLCLVACTAYAAQEAAAEGSRKLTVSANATVFADPDAAVITFHVAATEPKGKEAREAADKRANAIKEAITGLGLKSVTVEIVPLPLTLLVAADPGPDGSQPTQGAVARSLFSVRVREKDKEKLREMAVRIADLVVDNGGVGLTDEPTPRFRIPARVGAFGAGAAQPPEKIPGPSVEWICENNRQARQDAVKQAVDEALASAQVVAEKAKLKINDIDVHQTLPLPIIRSRLSEGATLASGRVAIEITVKVTCTY